MNRKELTARVAEKTGMLHKEVDQVLGTLIEEIQAQLARGENVKLQGLGTFEVKTRAPRKARDLTKNDTIEVPARQLPGFKASGLLRQLVSRSLS
jgi:DNA-binding protein HU-beta